MSDIRFQTKEEARWFVAYCRYLAQQREHEPSGDAYGYIAPVRKERLRQNARELTLDMIENTKEYPETAEYRIGEGVRA